MNIYSLDYLQRRVDIMTIEEKKGSLNSTNIIQNIILAFIDSPYIDKKITWKHPHL